MGVSMIELRLCIIVYCSCSLQPFGKLPAEGSCTHQQCFCVWALSIERHTHGWAAVLIRCIQAILPEWYLQCVPACVNVLTNHVVTCRHLCQLGGQWVLHQVPDGVHLPEPISSAVSLCRQWRWHGSEWRVMDMSLSNMILFSCLMWCQQCPWWQQLPCVWWTFNELFLGILVCNNAAQHIIHLIVPTPCTPCTSLHMIMYGCMQD